MTSRLVQGIVAVGLFAVIAMTWVTVKVLESAPSEPSVSERYSPPRTEWGDPDLQGSFTNSDEYGIPMNRPDAYSKFRIQDFPPEELARMNRERNRQVDGRPTEPLHEQIQVNHSRPWLVTDPLDGKVPPLIAESKQRGDGENVSGRPVKPWESVSLTDRCITRGLPGSMMPDVYGNAYEIFQAPGIVVITYEAIHEARVIFLDGRPHIGTAIRNYVGDARGRFEGDALVVETTNFTNRTSFLGSTEHLRLVERFTPVAADVLLWSITLHDSTTWATPWTFGMNLTKATGRPLEFACHEGNYSMRRILGE
jgi:hypothetical protein